MGLTRPGQQSGRGPDADQYIEQVACIGGSRCWGIGAYTHGSTHASANAILRWNGKRWTLAKAPQPGGNENELWGIDCTAPSACWAVGQRNNSAGATLNEALRWNGKSWKLVKTPQPGGTTVSGEQSVLYSVSCTSLTFCTSVGYIQNSAHQSLNQVLGWNGEKWKRN
ncbi:MAG TPA: hypothetical protein VFB39_10125 [Solirubrobacteraceae bacterium]|nr:hypothetical protein [Solirubrobacteraceae bacterium]